MTSPYSTYTADPSTVCQALIDKITGNKENFVIPVVDIFYGDQQRITHTPTICVEPSQKTRELAGAPNMTMNTFEIIVLVLINKVADTIITRKQSDQLAYDVEKFLHQDLQLNGLLIHGFVERSESGVTTKNNTMYRAARLVYHGLNKTSLAST